MNGAALGILHFPWDENYGVDKQGGRNPAQLWRRLIVHKANPRSAEYMKRRFAESYPHGRLVEVQASSEFGGFAGSTGLVVLLYPDSIGLGFGPLERLLRRHSGGASSLRVLTGRGRDFELTAGVRRRLLLRRALERTMLMEFTITPLIIAVALVVLASDLARGRR